MKQRGEVGREENDPDAATKISICGHIQPRSSSSYDVKKHDRSMKDI